MEGKSMIIMTPKLQEMMETMNDQDLEAFTDNNGIGEPAEADS